MNAHILDIRIYYEDTDAGGIVYHSNFLNFAERARCELLREVGYECSKIEQDLGFLFVVKHADIEYIKPARLDDALQVKTTLESMRNSSFQMRQIVQKDGQDLCNMLITLVCVETNEIKPVRFPDILREKLNHYAESKE
ncbi:MAG: tol-pal system-associated acyl-CoA thioesterase [Alphaproteobacteria bacterium]|nr:tol-pal system-associated acyl-CoA thioesterase [Alphaproteobacteria bacterium]